MNIEFTEAKLQAMALHIVGNAGREEGYRAGRELFALDDEDFTSMLTTFFLGSFNRDMIYRFNHETNLNMNEVFAYAGYIFDKVDDLHEQSVNILKHLYNTSTHPQVQAGELYVAFFEDVLVEDELVQALGIFKTEKKDDFLILAEDEEEHFMLEVQRGTSLNKIDKACLILNVEAEDGFRAMCVDLKSTDSKFWKDEFLGLTEIQDDGFYTRNYLGMCKDFVKEVYAREADKSEQVKFLNKAVDYFTSHDTFDNEEFVQEVVQDIPVADKFESYTRAWKEDSGISDDSDGFFIRQPDVQKMKKKFRNLIKLDTQIEIKLNTPADEQSEVIERGYDEEKSMFYYKVYFNKES